VARHAVNAQGTAQWTIVAFKWNELKARAFAQLQLPDKRVEMGPETPLL